MKSVQIISANQIELTERPEPVTGPGDVLLKVRKIGYCGSDLNTFRGMNPMVTYPRVPGHEIAATIMEIGKSVPASANLKVGLDVTVLPYTTCGKCTSCRAGRINACRNNQTLGVQRDGALLERFAVPWEKVISADGLNLEELALVEPLSVGFHSIERAQVTSKDTVVVLGAGMIGLGAIAAAGLVRKARVIAVDIDDAKLALAKKAGATEVVNNKVESLKDRIKQLTNDDGANVVVEAIGLPQTFTDAIDIACFAGRVVYIGYAKAAVSYETKYFVMKELDIRGSRNATIENFREVITMLRERKYPVKETVTKTVSLNDAPKAMADWSSNPSVVTKVHVNLD